MKKITLTFFLAAISSSLIATDHIMEVISGNVGSGVKVVEMDDQVYVPQGEVLKVYDGEAFTDYRMPVVAGMQLEFAGSILVHNNVVFLSMTDGTCYYISRFNSGGGFTRLALPGTLLTEVVRCNGQMYMLLQGASGVKLYSYDGVTLLELGSSLPTTDLYKLIVGGSYLYLNGFGIARGGTHWLVRYSGGTFRTFSLPTNTKELTAAFQVGSSALAYLVLDKKLVGYYNGSALTELFRTDPVYNAVHSPIMFRNDFYFRTNATPGLSAERLFKFHGIVRTEIFAPAGTGFIEPYYDVQLTVHRNAMYLPLEHGDTTSIYRYDGTSWERIYDWEGNAYGLTIWKRAGKLVFYQLLNGNRAVEWDGETFESFTVPAGIEWFVFPKVSTSCYHIWLTAYVDDSLPDYQWVLVKETFDSACVDSGGPAVIIPEKLQEYDRFFIGGHARERDWCWTGIDVDFDITPICTQPPCAPPSVQTTAIDKAGKIAWQKTFDRPFSTSIPLNDTQPYTLTLAVGKDKLFKGVLLFDKDLVNKGIEEMSLDMYPKEDHFFLTVMTDNNKPVSFTMTLRNTKGESLWQQQYTAPMDELIRAYAPKTGDYLQFSLAQAPKGTTTYYPNPFANTLTINTTEANGGVSVSLMDLNGNMISQKEFAEPGEYSWETNNRNPGLYIITIVENGHVRRELVQVK